MTAILEWFGCMAGGRVYDILVESAITIRMVGRLPVVGIMGRPICTAKFPIRAMYAICAPLVYSGISAVNIRPRYLVMWCFHS